MLVLWLSAFVPHTLLPQPLPVAERLAVRHALSLLGREFTGAYEQTPEALDSVRAEARRYALAIDTLSAVSRFLSVPERTPVGQRRAFHGFVSPASSPRGRLVLQTLESGEYVVVRTRDASVVPQLYTVAASFVEREGLAMPSTSPTLLTTASEGRPIFTLYVGPFRSPARVDASILQPKPSPAMARVSGLAGAWAVTMRGRAAPTDSFSTRFTSSVITPIHGGAFLQERVAMPLPGGRTINLIGLLGYDQFRATYRFAWLDDTYAMFDVHEGNWLNEQLVVNNLRTRTTLKDGGREVYSQMLWRDLAADRFVVESLASLDSGATWFTQAEAHYERTGPACELGGVTADTSALRALELEGARSNVAGMTAERARQFFSPDFRSWQPNGSATALPEIMAAYRNGRSVPWASRFDVKALSMNVYCDVAHVVGRADAHALTMPATVPPIRLEWINVWRRDRGTWRYVSNRFTMSGPARPQE